MKCSFCEQPLVCKNCDKPFHPKRSETHEGAFQPDTEVSCPECKKTLVCRACGFVFGQDQEEDET